jgi:hypothetical protein
VNPETGSEYTIAWATGQKVYLITETLWNSEPWSSYHEEQSEVGVRLDKGQAVRELRQTLLTHDPQANFVQFDMDGHELHVHYKESGSPTIAKHHFWVSKDGCCYITFETRYEINELDTMAPLKVLLP